MTTLKTLIAPVTPPKQIKGKETCKNGHPWTKETTRWRYRERPNRGKHSWTGWERDCLVCHQVSAGRSGSGLRSQSWLPGATE